MKLKYFILVYVFILVFNIFIFNNSSVENLINIQPRSGDITELENGDILSAPSYTPASDGVYQLENGKMLIISESSVGEIYYSILDLDTNTIESSTRIDSMYNFGSNQSHSIEELPNGNVFILGNTNTDYTVDYAIINRNDGSLFYEGKLEFPDGLQINNDFSINPQTGAIFTDSKRGNTITGASPIIFKPVEGSDYTQWTSSVISDFDSTYSTSISDTLAIKGSDNFVVSSAISTGAGEYEYYLYNSNGEKLASFQDEQFVLGTTKAYLYALDTPNTFLWFEETGMEYYLIDFNNSSSTPITISGISLNKAVLLESGNILLTDRNSGSYSIISPYGDVLVSDSITDNSLIMGFGVKSDTNIYVVHEDWSYTLLKQSNFPPVITNLEIDNIDNSSISINYEITESETSSSTSLEIFDVGADGTMNTEDDESVKLIDFTENLLIDTVTATTSFDDGELEKQFYGKLEYVDATFLTKWVYSSTVDVINIITPIINTFDVTSDLTSLTVVGNISDINLLVSEIRVTATDQEDKVFNLNGNTNTTISGQTTFEGLSPEQNYNISIIVTYLSFENSYDTVTESKTVSTLPIPAPTISSFVLSIDSNSVIADWSITDTDLLATSVDIKLNTDEEVQSYDLTDNTETTVANTTTFEGLNFNTSYNVEIVVNYAFDSITYSINQNDSITTSSVDAPIISTFSLSATKYEVLIDWSINDENLVATSVDIKLNTDEKVQNYDLTGNTETIISNTTTFEGLNFNTSYNVEIVVSYLNGSETLTTVQTGSITTENIVSPEVTTLDLTSTKDSIEVNWNINDSDLVATSVDIKLNTNEEIQSYDLTDNTETTVANTTTFEGLNFNTSYTVEIVVNYLAGTVNESDSISTQNIIDPEIVTFNLTSTTNSVSANWSIYDSDLVATSVDIKLNTDEEVQSYDLTDNTETTVANTTTFEGLNFNTSYTVEIVVNYLAGTVNESDSISTINIATPEIVTFDLTSTQSSIIIDWTINDSDLVATSVDIKLNGGSEIQSYDLSGSETTVTNTTVFEDLNYNSSYTVEIVVNFLDTEIYESKSINTIDVPKPIINSFEFEILNDQLIISWDVNINQELIKVTKFEIVDQNGKVLEEISETNGQIVIDEYTDIENITLVIEWTDLDDNTNEEWKVSSEKLLLPVIENESKTTITLAAFILIMLLIMIILLSAIIMFYRR